MSQDINFSLDYLEQAASRRSHIKSTLEKIYEKYSISSQNILEVGCGLGSNLDIFRSDNTVVGIDGLEDAVASAARRGIVVFQSDLERPPLPIETNWSDLTLCIDVMEHISNASGLILELKRVTKPTGLVVINVPNHFTLRGRIKLLFGAGMDMHKFFPESDDWNNPHVRFFTYGGFLRFVENFGLYVVEDFSYFGTVECLAPPNESRVVSLLKRLIAQKFPALILGGFFMVLRAREKQ